MFRILICRRSSADEQRHSAARLARRLPRLRGFGLYFELPERAVSRVVRKVQRTLSRHPSWRLQPGFFQWTRANQSGRNPPEYSGWKSRNSERPFCPPLDCLLCWSNSVAIHDVSPRRFPLSKLRTGLCSSLLFHPLSNIGRAINDFYATGLTGSQKPNSVDIHEVYFNQIQSYAWAAVLDLSAQVIELLRSEFAAQPDSSPAFSRKSFDFERHQRGIRSTPVTKQRGGRLQFVDRKRFRATSSGESSPLGEISPPLELIDRSHVEGKDVTRRGGYEALNLLRLIPNFLIFELSVSRGIPSLAAAPVGPPTTPPASRKAVSIISFSCFISTPVRATVGRETSDRSCLNHVSSTAKQSESVRMTARSITFCSSRTLPGHSYAWRSFRVLLSIVLNFFPALPPNRAMKYSTSKGMSAARSLSEGI